MTDMFKYKIGKRTITAPSIKQMPIGVRRKTRAIKDGEEQMWVAIEEVLSEADLAAVDSLDNDGFTAFMEAWEAFSGGGLGESSASSDS